MSSVFGLQSSFCRIEFRVCHFLSNKYIRNPSYILKHLLFVKKSKVCNISKDQEFVTQQQKKCSVADTISQYVGKTTKFIMIYGNVLRFPRKLEVHSWGTHLVFSEVAIIKLTPLLYFFGKFLSCQVRLHLSCGIHGTSFSLKLSVIGGQLKSI